MKNLVFIILFCAATDSSLYGQSKKNSVYQKIISADSVILISHLATHVPIIDSNKRAGIHKLIVKGKVNYQIIKQQYHLDKLEIDSLASILLTPNGDDKIQDIGCFMPHHGILIFKKKKYSYFDICFDCQHFITSKDIRLSDELDLNTWKVLERFFRNRNLNYGMSENEINSE